MKDSAGRFWQPDVTVATVVVAKWEKGLDKDALDAALAGGPRPAMAPVQIDED